MRLVYLVFTKQENISERILKYEEFGDSRVSRKGEDDKKISGEEL
jgi:hypothetical protein